MGIVKELTGHAWHVMRAPFTGIRMLSRGDAAAFYTLLGDDLIFFHGDDFRDSDKPLWLNFGYWKDARNYPDAASALARLLADWGDLREDDDVLDVGFGFGEQDLLWARERRLQHITGINITPLHVEVGKERVAKALLSDRIDLQLGSATDLRAFAERRFDKVVALECAFHFHTREEFFKQAFRVLKPGGRLSATDLLSLPGYRSRFVHKLFRRYGDNPEANVYDLDTCLAKLRSAGYVNVRGESIARHVYPGIDAYTRLRREGAHGIDAAVHFQGDEHEGRIRNGMDDYVIYSADKPLDA